jgi:hypothetical protein
MPVNDPSDGVMVPPETAESSSIGTGAVENAPSDGNARRLDEAPIPAPVIPFHALAGIFPVGDDAGIRELARRIEGNVPIDLVILYEGKILDGADLYLACLIIGREPTFETYAGDDPFGYLIGRRLPRGGPLSESQRAMTAARASNLQLGANQYTEGVPIGRASELLNVSPQSIHRARFVLRHGPPDLIAAVDSGRTTVSAVKQELERRARQASKERSVASISVQAAAESPEADRISEPNTAGEPNTTSPPEADGSIDQAGGDPVDGEYALTESADDSEARIMPTAWLWPDYIPAIGVTALIGQSNFVPLVAAKLAATVAFGDPFPDHHKADFGKAVLWTSSNPFSRPTSDRVYYARADLKSAPYGVVDFLDPEFDEFGLPIRHLFADLRRLRHKRLSELTLVVIDYLSDYLGFGNLERDIERLGSALRGLQAFAIDRGTAVLLPLQVPVRSQLDFITATRLVAASADINSVLIVERGTEAGTGTLTKFCDQTEQAVREYQFHLRQRWASSENKVPVIEWDSLVKPNMREIHRRRKLFRQRQATLTLPEF